jgi:hypothetical protein
MRILFVMPHQRHARRYELVLRELIARGHHVELGLKGQHHPEADDLIVRLGAGTGRLTRTRVPVREGTWAALAEGLRRGIDYLRYLEPAYAGAPKLRARGARLAPAIVVRLARLRPVRGRRGIRLLDRALRGIERTVPDSAPVRDLLASVRPDLMLVSPLVDRPWQADYIRVARSMGLRSALCVASWDNLTNKGLVRDVPDRIYVWNDDQRREAVELHGLPDARIVVTGAHSFDHWFDWKASVDAREFRRRLSLPTETPLLLYACSSKFIAPDEPRFVERWLRALRAAPDQRLSGASVLIRPHPTTGDDWDRSRLADMPGVAVWPPRGEVHVDVSAKSAFFDSIYHSAAVVGVNTSALIETAIVGRPVFTVLDADFEATQEGTLHFRYLLRENGGPLTVAVDLAQHFEQLGMALAGEHRQGHEEGSFVHRFVRPGGLERRAAAVMADALEAQAAEPPPAPARATRSRLPGPALLRLLARADPRRAAARRHASPRRGEAPGTARE